MPLNELFSFILQMSAVIAIASFCYLFVRREVNFLSLVGLKHPKMIKSGGLFFLPVLFAYLFAQYYLLSGLYIRRPQYNLTDTSQILSLIIWAILTTSFCEEILFRGVIFNVATIFVRSKKLASVIQAILFSALHGLIFINIRLPDAHLIKWSSLFISIFTMSLFLVYLNERFGGGSIIPGWIFHGLGNILSQVLLSFLIIH